MPKLVVLLALLICAGANGAELSTKESAKAKQLYVAKCAKCHALPDLTKYSKSDLESWMTKMAKKSRLSPDQADLLTQYAEAQRNAKPPSAPPK